MEFFFWLQEEDPKEDISIVLIIWENSLPPCSSRTFWKQSYWSYIAGQRVDWSWNISLHVACRKQFQSSFNHQQWIDTWRSRFEQRTNNVLLACWSKRWKSQRPRTKWLLCTTSKKEIPHRKYSCKKNPSFCQATLLLKFALVFFLVSTMLGLRARGDDLVVVLFEFLKDETKLAQSCTDRAALVHRRPGPCNARDALVAHGSRRELSRVYSRHIVPLLFLFSKINDVTT